MPVDSPQFRNLDNLTDGRLEEIIAEHVAAGHSPEHMVRLFYADYRFEVSRQTVDRWIDQLGLDPDEPEAAAS